MIFFLLVTIEIISSSLSINTKSLDKFVRHMKWLTSWPWCVPSAWTRLNNLHLLWFGMLISATHPCRILPGSYISASCIMSNPNISNKTGSHWELILHKCLYNYAEQYNTWMCQNMPATQDKIVLFECFPQPEAFNYT